MPSRPKKICNQPNCDVLITKGAYCEEHKEHENTKFRNKKQRSHPWYYTRFWKDLRKRKLAEDPVCEYCEEKGKLTPANTVDHIKDWLGTGREWELFSDWDNLKSACVSCHSKKTAQTNKK